MGLIKLFCNKHNKILTDPLSVKTHWQNFTPHQKSLQAKPSSSISVKEKPEPEKKVLATKKTTVSPCAGKTNDAGRHTSGILTKNLQRQSSLPNIQLETWMPHRKKYLNIPEVRLHPDQQQGMPPAGSGEVSELSKSKTSKGEQHSTKTQQNKTGTKLKQPVPPNSSNSNAETTTTQERNNPKRCTESKSIIVGVLLT